MDEPFAAFWSLPTVQSRPSRALLVATLAIVALTLALPWSPLAGILGFQPLPIPILSMIGVIVGLYVGTAEIAKRIFYKR